MVVLVVVEVAGVALQEDGNMVMTYSVLFLGVVAGLWGFLLFNRLTAAVFGVDQSWSNIEVELKRRLDLIDNLVQVVKGYTSHESETLKSVTMLRGSSGQISEATRASSAEPEIKESLGKLFAIAESYPQLKADKQFLTLQTELSNTENRIAERREVYNQGVSLYKNLCSAFPSNLIASSFGFTDRGFFDAPEEVAATPSVKFS